MDADKAIRNGLALLTASLRQEVDALQVRAYLHGLKALPADVILSAAERLSSAPVRAGQKRYFPSVPEWAGACADIVDERRADAARRAKALTEDCGDCRGSGWRDAEGPNAVERCTCVTRALALIADAGQAILRPALMAHQEDSA